MNKTVHLEVDGRPALVHTFAGDVAGALRSAGLTLGPHDAVTPAPRSRLYDGEHVAVVHGRMLHLTVNDRQRDSWVAALTVGAALQQLHLAVPGEWTSMAPAAQLPPSGSSLVVRLPQRVTVLVDGHRLVRHTTAATVRELLTSLRVHVRRLDRVHPAPTTYPTSGMVVSVDRITQHVVRREVEVPFRTRDVRTSSLYIGHSRVLRRGQPGLRVETFRLTWKNHHLVRQRLLRSRLRSAPRTEVVAIGTKRDLDWAALAQCESGGNPTEVSADGEYRGLYQFTLGAWSGVGGSGDPIDASVDEQTYRARLLYAREGAGAWPVCGRYLYT